MKNSLPTRAALIGVLILSLFLNLWANSWGAPDGWHPDELTVRTMGMVAQRTLNPHHFAYGGLHYYILGAGAVVPAYAYSLVRERSRGVRSAEETEKARLASRARTIRLARAISATMGAAVVILTFAIAAYLFTPATGLLAALFLSTAMAFVGIAHFATVDMAANFWYWLACFFGLLAWKRGGAVWHVLAAISAGFAVGTKLDRLLVIFPLLLAIWFGARQLTWRRVPALLLIMAVTYSVSNPTLVLSPFEFLDGLTRDTFFNAVREQGQTSYGAILSDMHAGMGTPLFLLGIVGLMHGLRDIWYRHERTALVWLLSTIVPYYLFLGSRLVPFWYLPLLFPPLMILGARTVVILARHSLRPLRWAIVGFTVFAVVFSLLHTLSLLLQFSHDGRLEANRWIRQHVLPPASIEVSWLMWPIVDQWRYTVLPSPRDRRAGEFALRWRADLERHRLYRWVQGMIFEAEAWTARRWGLARRKEPYAAWFDQRALALQQMGAPPPPQADYVLVQESQPERISVLTQADSGYKLIRVFRYAPRFLPHARFDFVNPTVYLYQRR